MDNLKFEKVIKLNVKLDKIIQLVSDLKNADKLLSPFNLDNRIKEVSDQKAVVEEKIVFPFIKNKVLQETTYEFVEPNVTRILIISGPFKDTRIQLKYQEDDSILNVILEGDLKTNLKYKFFRSMIKERFLRNFTNVLKQLERLAFLTHGKTWKDSISGGGRIITITYNNTPIKFHNWHKSSFTEVFLDESYSSLPVSGRIVVDIGANIGDSAIYFAIRGAKKVIAIEPFPANFEIAKRNISLNNLEEKIELILGGISKEDKKISIDDKYIGTGAGNTNIKHGSSISNEKEGTQINTFTLHDLVDSKKIDDAVLKVDCEGCEYDLVLGSDKSDLRKFSNIILEFHKGHEDLMKCLEKSGFGLKADVSAKKVTGLLYAVRN